MVTSAGLTSPRRGFFYLEVVHRRGFSVERSPFLTLILASFSVELIWAHLQGVGVDRTRLSPFRVHRCTCRGTDGTVHEGGHFIVDGALLKRYGLRPAGKNVGMMHLSRQADRQTGRQTMGHKTLSCIGGGIAFIRHHEWHYDGAWCVRLMRVTCAIDSAECRREVQTVRTRQACILHFWNQKPG